MKQLNIFDTGIDSKKNRKNCKSVIISRDLLAPFESKEKDNSMEFDAERVIWREHVLAVAYSNRCTFVEARELLINKRGVERDDLIDFKLFEKFILKAFIELSKMKEHDKEIIEEAVDITVFEKIVNNNIKSINMKLELHDSNIEIIDSILIQLNEKLKKVKGVELSEVILDELIKTLEENIEKEKQRKFKDRIIDINIALLKQPRIEMVINEEGWLISYKEYKKNKLEGVNND